MGETIEACRAGMRASREGSWGEVLRQAGLGGVRGSLVARQAGVVSGAAACAREANRLGLDLHVRREGERVDIGDEVARFRGPAEAVAQARETLIATLAKPSGVATAALAFADATNGRPRIVSTFWRSLPDPLREAVKLALKSGGASAALSDTPFLEIEQADAGRLGGVGEAVGLFRRQSGLGVAVALRAGDEARLASEACEAADAGASFVIMRNDAARRAVPVSKALRSMGLRGRVELVLRGDYRLEDISLLKTDDINAIDVGRALADAPFLDIDLFVSGFERTPQGGVDHG